MSDTPLINRDEEDAERRGAEPASDHYTGEPCRFCGRIRVYERRDGRLICEKCEMFDDFEESKE